MDTFNLQRHLSSLMLILCFTTAVLSMQRECFTDSDCSSGGSLYCHEFQCTSCVPCSTFNRQGPARSADGSRCAANAESCGPCSPGYHPEEIKGPLRFLMRTYRCEKTNRVPFRIEVLFGSLMIVAVAIVLSILFKVWRDTKSKKEFKQVIVDTDSVELVHTSRCFYENQVVDIAETGHTSEEHSPNESPRGDPLSDSGSTIVLHDHSDDEKPVASFLSSGISAGSYEHHECCVVNQESHSVRMSNTNLIIVPAEQQGLVEAVPIGAYHVPCTESDNKPEQSAVQVIELATEPIRPATESNHWAWSSVSVSSGEVNPSVLSDHVVIATLVRCLSQDNLAQSCPNVGRRRSSDPSLTQNGYEHVHIALANHRTVPAPCAATSDGMLIDESHQTRTISFSSAPDVMGDYEPIYPALPDSPIVDPAITQIEIDFPTGAINEVQRSASNGKLASDKEDELSVHMLLSSEDTIAQSARNSVCFPSETAIKTSDLAKSQTLTTSETEGATKLSTSCPRLTDTN